MYFQANSTGQKGAIADLDSILETGNNLTTQSPPSYTSTFPSSTGATTVTYPKSEGTSVAGQGVSTTVPAGQLAVQELPAALGSMGSRWVPSLGGSQPLLSAGPLTTATLTSPNM